MDIWGWSNGVFPVHVELMHLNNSLRVAVDLRGNDNKKTANALDKIFKQALDSNGAC